MSNNNIILTVVIVNWNTKDLVIKCIESILKEDIKDNIEILVVDNASSDGSVNALNKKFKNIKIIENKKNYGFAKANNIGISESTGKYIALINSDILLLENCLTKLITFHEQNQDIGIVGPKLLNSDLTLQLSCKEFPSVKNSINHAFGLTKIFKKTKIFSGEHMRYFAHDKIINVDSLTGALLMVKKIAIDQVGLLDENFFMYGEETDWCKRFWEAGWRVVFYPDAKAIHFGGQSSSKNPNRFYKELYISKLYFYKKHFKISKRILLLMILSARQVIRICGEFLRILLNPTKVKLRYNNIKLHYNIIKITWFSFG